MLKKVLLITGLLVASEAAFAADFCPGLSGIWTGSYEVSGKTYSADFFFDVQKGMLYAYTLPGKDSAGYNFSGTDSGNYVLWANCSNSTLSNLYFVNRAKKCGGVNAESQPINFRNNKPLILALPYNNTNVTMSLMPKAQRMPIKYGLLSRTSDLAKANKTWSACTP